MPRRFTRQVVSLAERCHACSKRRCEKRSNRDSGRNARGHHHLRSAFGPPISFHSASAYLSEAEWQACLTAVEKAAPGLSCASGSLPPGVPVDFYARFRKPLAKPGKRRSSTRPAKPREAIKSPFHLIKPNLEELAGLVDDELTNEAAQLKACRAVLARSKLEAIALRLGAARRTAGNAKKCLSRSLVLGSTFKHRGRGRLFHGRADLGAGLR